MIDWIDAKIQPKKTGRYLVTVREFTQGSYKDDGEIIHVDRADYDKEKNQWRCEDYSDHEEYKLPGDDPKYEFIDKDYYTILRIVGWAEMPEPFKPTTE